MLSLFLPLAAALLSAGPGPTPASCAPQPVTPLPAPVGPPGFSVGEDLHYSASFGRIHVGSGEMRLVERDTVDGHQTWKAVLHVSGGFSKLSVHDFYRSWFDSTSFDSYRFDQSLHEPRYHAEKDYRIDQAARLVRKNDEAPTPSVANAMDDVSIVYFVRTLPLEVGRCYEVHRYFQPDANPVVIRVLRHERITVPAGTFEATVVQPEITTSGIFSQHGHAELWFSDDSAHTLLQLKSGLAFGSINLYLTSR